MVQFSDKSARLIHKVKNSATAMADERPYVELTLRDSQALVTALIKPQPVNERLEETIRLYREKISH